MEQARVNPAPIAHGETVYDIPLDPDVVVSGLNHAWLTHRQQRRLYENEEDGMLRVLQKAHEEAKRDCCAGHARRTKKYLSMYKDIMKNLFTRDEPRYVGRILSKYMMGGFPIQFLMLTGNLINAYRLDDMEAELNEKRSVMGEDKYHFNMDGLNHMREILHYALHEIPNRRVIDTNPPHPETSS